MPINLHWFLTFIEFLKNTSDWHSIQSTHAQPKFPSRYSTTPGLISSQSQELLNSWIHVSLPGIPVIWLSKWDPSFVISNVILILMLSLIFTLLPSSLVPWLFPWSSKSCISVKDALWEHKTIENRYFFVHCDPWISTVHVYHEA